MAMYPCLSLPSLSFPTLSGSIVTFNSQYAGLPLKSHKIAVTAMQSGTGTPSPSNPRAITGWSALNVCNRGRNVWGNGVQIASSSIGGIYKGWYIPYNEKMRIVLFDKDTTQSLSGVYLGFTKTGKDATGGNSWIVTNGAVSYATIATYQYNYISIYPGTQETLDKLFNRFYILTVVDDSPYNVYVPYTGQNTTIPLGGTYFGGEYDARTGVLTVDNVKFSTTWGSMETKDIGADYTRKSITVNTGSSASPYSTNQISNVGVKQVSNDLTSNHFYVNGSTLQMVLANDTSNDTIIDVVYKLATPTTIQLPPCPIETLLGENNIWADTGDTTLQYPKFG